jgi:hypothetical protein
VKRDADKTKRSSYTQLEPGSTRLSIPAETEAAYFDHLLNAWVLSKHADILAAFHASSLAPSGPHQRKAVERKPLTLSFEVTFTPGPRAYVAPASLLSRKPYLVCWEMLGSL